MAYQLIENAEVLVPNKEHKNFTASGEILEKETIVEGKPKEVLGMRRGKPFVYSLFETKDNKIIYIKSIKPMNTTEVTLGADAQTTPTKVNLVPAEKAKTAKRKNEVYGLILGGLAGFAYAKYKKHDLKKMAMYIAVGAATGFGVGLLLDHKKPAVITASK